MKKIYALLFVSLLLFIGYSCEDGSLSHGDVYIPDPVEESDEDDGFATEPTTTSVVRMSIGEGHQHQMIDGLDVVLQNGLTVSGTITTEMPLWQTYSVTMA